MLTPDTCAGVESAKACVEIEARRVQVMAAAREVCLEVDAVLRSLPLSELGVTLSSEYVPLSAFPDFSELSESVISDSALPDASKLVSSSELPKSVSNYDSQPDTMGGMDDTRTGQSDHKHEPQAATCEATTVALACDAERPASTRKIGAKRPRPKQCPAASPLSSGKSHPASPSPPPQISRSLMGESKPRGKQEGGFRGGGAAEAAGETETAPSTASSVGIGLMRTSSLPAPAPAGSKMALGGNLARSGGKKCRARSTDDAAAVKADATNKKFKGKGKQRGPLSSAPSSTWVPSLAGASFAGPSSNTPGNPAAGANKARRVKQKTVLWSHSPLSLSSPALSESKKPATVDRNAGSTAEEFATDAHTTAGGDGGFPSVHQVSKTSGKKNSQQTGKGSSWPFSPESFSTETMSQALKAPARKGTKRALAGGDSGGGAGAESGENDDEKSVHHHDNHDPNASSLLSSSSLSSTSACGHHSRARTAGGAGACLNSSASEGGRSAGSRVAGADRDIARERGSGKQEKGGASVTDEGRSREEGALLLSDGRPKRKVRSCSLFENDHLLCVCTARSGVKYPLHELV